MGEVKGKAMKEPQPMYKDDVSPADLTAELDRAAACLDAVTDEPDIVLAALIESGWRPTDEQLRAMGGVDATADLLVPTSPVWRFPKEATDG